MFDPFAQNDIDQLTGIQGDTKAEYRKPLQQKLSPWFRGYSLRDGKGGVTREHVARWVNDLEAGRPAPLDPKGTRRRKLKPKTFRNAHGLLPSICQAAVTADPPLRTRSWPQIEASVHDFRKANERERIRQTIETKREAQAHAAAWTNREGVAA